MYVTFSSKLENYMSLKNGFENFILPFGFYDKEFTFAKY
jgi:hypothetical protein